MSYDISKNERLIFHVDMDAFFASIEIVENPSLKGKAVIVGGASSRRGVVSTCSYEARRFGVHSAMSIAEAEKRCPHAIFVEGNYELYRAYSNKVMEIFLDSTPYVQIVGIDEAYLDVTSIAKQYGGPFALGQMLKDIIMQQTKLSCSVGIASNKLVAKIVSSIAKPNGLFRVLHGEEGVFLAPLPIDCLPGIGKKTAPKMKAEGFETIGQLQEAGAQRLLQLYGNWGYHCYQAAYGRDARPVEWEAFSPKSISAETTFEQDLEELSSLRVVLLQLCKKVWIRLKRNQMRSRSFSIKLRSANFYTVTRSYTFISHVNDLDEISRCAVDLLERHASPLLPLRLLGISLEKLTDSYWQPTFWD